MLIKILFEDENLLVVDKPAGLLVHPKNSQDKSYTIVSWLFAKYPNLQKLDWPDRTRAGIVHRLDQDTSGLLILAKSPDILNQLQEQFKARKVKKIYLALVVGKIEDGGEIESFIGKGQDKQISRFLNLKGTMKRAKTTYNIVRHYKLDSQNLPLLQLRPETGRTHQLRVQLKSMSWPVIGDKVYTTKLAKNIAKNLTLNRQFLHAAKLEFIHPKNDKKLIFESKLPKKLLDVLHKLKV